MNVKQLQQNIPSLWKFGELGNFLIDIGDGGTPSRSKDEYFGGEIPWVVVNDIQPHIKQTKDTLTKEGFQKSSAKLWPAGSVILSFGATIGEVGIADIPVTTKQGIAGIIPNSNLLNTYLYYLLLNSNKLLHKLSSGSTIKEVRPSVIKKQIEVLIPPIKEQHKIAEILGTVDDDIAKTQEVIKVTEKLKRGLMQQLFTRGIGHTKFNETELGEIPEGWEVNQLKDISTKIGDGLHGTPRYSEDSEYYFINGNNISESEIKIYAETKKISVEEHNLHKKELTDRSILLSINGTIGNIGFYKGEKVALGKSVAFINCSNKVSKEFIAYQLKTERIYRHFTKELTGTTIKNLSLGTIRQTPIFVPKVEEQQKIVDILFSIDEKISVNKKLKEKLTLLKKGLMQDLLSGKVRTNI